jgi:ADP-ribose pyrophosphatase
LKPILKFVAIQRRDTKEWAIPGGMRDPGELVSKTLVREFAEEALSHNLAYNKDNQIDVSRGEIESKLSNFFRDGVQIYKGYVDDPRNTDNAWMETIACNFHDEKGDLVGSLNLVGGDDAEHANLLDLNSNLKLFASHVDFLAQVAALRKAHW